MQETGLPLPEMLSPDLSLLGVPTRRQEKRGPPASILIECVCGGWGRRVRGNGHGTASEKQVL